MVQQVSLRAHAVLYPSPISEHTASSPSPPRWSLSTSSFAMYSSLFSAGLVQLWEEKAAPSPLPSPSVSTFASQRRPQRQLRSFLSFEDFSTVASTSRRSHRLGSSTSKRRKDDNSVAHVRTSSPSSSRCVESYFHMLLEWN